jgi:hypothetical protein
VLDQLESGVKGLTTARLPQISIKNSSGPQENRGKARPAGQKGQIDRTTRSLK